jgi:hypothetical protein
MAWQEFLYQQDCDISKLDGKTVAIIGYGSQGHAHALNLKDSGVDVKVGLYEGSKSARRRPRQGLEVVSNAEAAKWADIIMILINDECRPHVQEGHRAEPDPGKTLAFAHGFNIHFGCIKPPGRQRHHDRPEGPGPHRRSSTSGARAPRAWSRPAGRHRRRLGTSRSPTARYRRRPRGVLETDFRPRPRPTSSASRRALRRRDRLMQAASRRWSRPATTRATPTSSASTR